MTRLQRLSLVSLAAGLWLAVLVVPWSVSTIKKSSQLLAMQQEMLTPAPMPVPTVDPQAQIAQAERLEQQRLAREQAARITAELAKVAIPAPKPVRTPEPPRPAYSFAAPGPELMPLEGWVDQPNKDRPGRIHTNLMVRHVRTPQVRREVPRAPCLVMVAKPAERIERPYGWLEVPARTIPVPCGG